MAFLPSNTDEMSDDEIQQLMALGVIPDKQELLKQQMTLAEKLRYGSMPEMRGEGGRVQTAANPLEFLASGIQGYRAGKELKDLKKQQIGLLNDQTNLRALFALRRKKKPEEMGSGGDSGLY